MKRAAALLFAIALPAFADRFNVTFEGKPISGVEVCASRAGALASPVTRFLTGGAPNCSRANGDVRFPPGTWNVYARRGAEMISDSAVLAVGGESKTHDLSLLRAASVDAATVALRGDEALFAYVVSSGAMLPVNATVPATRIVPLIVAGQRIRAIGVPVTPEAGRTVRFEFQADGAQKGSVVVPVTIGAAPTGKSAPPDVTLAGSKQRADSALLFFRGVPAGEQRITLSGERWKDAQRSVKVDAGAIAVADPLVARSGSKLRVHWWAPVALASLAHPERECGKKQEATPILFALSLLECPDQKPDGTIEMVDRRQCSVVVTRELPPDAVKGAVELPDIGAGLYFARVTYPGLPPFFKSIRVTPDDINDADVEVRYVTFFGKVMRAGKPLHVRLFDAVTDPETGDYTAVMTRLPKVGVPLRLQPCEGGRSLTVVPDEAPAENARYDIDVPDNRLTIHVVDADSHAPIEKAMINMAALENDKPEATHFAGPSGTTDAEGRLVIESAVANKRLQICASRTDYENKCAERFRLDSDAEKTIELALNKATIRHGRVVLAGAQQSASVTWWSPDGRLTEIVQVKEDGTFEFKRTHAAGEIVTYASANQPFIAMRQPPLNADEVFEIRLAIGARLRTFQVALSPDAHDNAYVTIALGDMVVPLDALARHISMHGTQASLQPGWVANVPDVVESAPIHVIVIPFSFVRSHDIFGVDFAMFPEVHSLPQQLLGERTRLDFR